MDQGTQTGQKLFAGQEVFVFLKTGTIPVSKRINLNIPEDFQEKIKAKLDHNLNVVISKSVIADHNLATPGTISEIGHHVVISKECCLKIE